MFSANSMVTGSGSHFGSLIGHLHQSSIEATFVKWVIFRVVKGAIPAFYFREQTESMRVVDTMACSTTKGCFNDGSFSLQGQGVFVVCQEGAQVGPQFLIRCGFSISVDIEVRGECTAFISDFELSYFEGFDQVFQRIIHHFPVPIFGGIDFVEYEVTGFLVIPDFADHIEDMVLIQGCEAMDRKEEVRAWRVGWEDLEYNSL